MKPLLDYRIGALVNLDKALIARAAETKIAYFSPTKNEIYELAAASLDICPGRDGFIHWKNYLAGSAEAFPTIDDLRAAFDAERARRQVEELKNRLNKPGRAGDAEPATIAPARAVAAQAAFSAPDMDEDPFEVKKR